MGGGNFMFYIRNEVRQRFLAMLGFWSFGRALIIFCYWGFMRYIFFQAHNLCKQAVAHGKRDAVYISWFRLRPVPVLLS